MDGGLALSAAEVRAKASWAAALVVRLASAMLWSGLGVSCVSEAVVCHVVHLWMDPQR